MRRNRCKPRWRPGLLGLGTVFVGTIEGAARILFAAIPDPKAKVSLPALADKIVADHARPSEASLGSVIRFTSLLTREFHGYFRWQEPTVSLVLTSG